MSYTKNELEQAGRTIPEGMSDSDKICASCFDSIMRVSEKPRDSNFCGKCGNSIPSLDEFCTNCGAKKTGNIESKKTEENHARIRKERSGAWYLAPILFSLIGGIVAYFVVRNDDPKLARNCLVIGVVIFIVVYSIIIATGVNVLDNNIVR